MIKRRIRKYNDMNWVIERYVPPQIIKAGFNVGQMSKGSWTVDGYYGRLEDIPNGLMKRYLSCSDSDVKSILKAIEKAKRECLKIIEAFVKENENAHG